MISTSDRAAPILAAKEPGDMATTRLFTADDLLGTTDEWHELVRGELHEVSPASTGSAVVASVIHGHLFAFVRPRRLGYLTTGEGGFILSRNPDTVVAPDVGFIRYSRVPADFTFDHFFPVPPDFVVEVVSPSDRPRNVAEKVSLYLESGVPLVWVCWPARKAISVHRPGRPAVELRVGDVLDGDDVLPAFQLAVADVFREP